MRHYKYRSEQIQLTAELPYQKYDVDTIIAQWIDFVDADLGYKTFYPEFVRMLNDSNVDASVKFNDGKEFTLLAGSTMGMPFDGLSKVSIRSKEEGQSTKIEVSIWGRLDLDV